MSIRARVILITLGILFFAISATTFISSYFFSREYSKALTSRAFVIGRSLKFELDRLLSFGIPLHNLVGFEKQCREIVDKYEQISYAMVVDREGQILFHNDPSQQNQTITDSVTLQAVKTPHETIQLISTQGVDYYDVIIPIVDSYDEHLGAVRIGFPAAVVNQKVTSLISYSVGVALVSLSLAVILLVAALSAWVTQPLGNLLTTIQEIRNNRAI